MGLGSGINLFRIPDPSPEVKQAPDPIYGSATLVLTAPSSLVSLVVIKVPSSPVMLDVIGINDAKHDHQWSKSYRVTITKNSDSLFYVLFSRYYDNILYVQMAQQQTVSGGEYKEIFYNLTTVLRIRDVYPGSKFFHHGSRVKNNSEIRIRSKSKNLSILTQKIVSKLWETWSGMFIPDPDLDFLPIPDLGVKKAPDPQHCFTEVSVTNTVTHLLIIQQQTRTNRKSQIL